MDPTSNHGDDGVLDDFFSQIERLSIAGAGGGEHEHGNDTDPRDSAAAAANRSGPGTREADEGGHCARPEPKSQTQTRQLKESMIHRAEERKGAWTAFSIPDAKKTSTTTTNSNGRPRVSFSLGAKKAKKKNQPAAASPLPTFASVGDVDGDKNAEAPSPRVFPPDHPSPPPRWIVVLDTCALLESYGSVCELLDLAKETEAVLALESRRPPTGSCWREALSLVVPYTVWGELDHRSKECSKDSDSEHNRFQARRAARMLAEELGHRSVPHQTPLPLLGGAAGVGSARGNAGRVLRTQSRAESHRAVEEFLFGGSPHSPKVTNDDRILACALGEQNRYSSERLLGGPVAGGYAPNGGAVAGGVVLATSDKVLSGKSRADGVVALAPEEFAQYYRRRMASLRSRTRLASASASVNELPR